MSPQLHQLLSIASDPVCPAGVDAVVLDQYLQPWGSRGEELADLLLTRNGAYAFESALLIRPFDFDGKPHGLRQWNKPELWIREYSCDLEGRLFFAEDVFGVQFVLHGNRVSKFDPEIGDTVDFADSLEQWAGKMLSNYRFETGWPLAHDWQIRNHPLEPGMRLLPKVPFILGGKFEADFLYALEDVKAMSFRASIYNQIRDMPDGTTVRLNVINAPDEDLPRH